MVTLKSTLEVTQSHWKWHRSIAYEFLFVFHSCTVFEIKRDVGRETPKPDLYLTCKIP